MFWNYLYDSNAEMSPHPIPYVFSITVLTYFLSSGQKRDVNIYSSAVIIFSHNN